MKKYIALFIVLIFAITGWAFPPTPPTNMASPGAIGGTTPAAGTFTTLIANTTAYIGDTANAKSTQGLTINQGANDDEIISLKSSDVAHSFTGITEADTFGAFVKASAAAGGLRIWGITDSNIGGALDLWGLIGASNPDDIVAPIYLRGSKLDGATGRAGLGAAETVLKVYNETTERISVLGDGKTNFWKVANDGTNYEGLQIDPATAGNMQIKAIGGGTGSSTINITMEPKGDGAVKPKDGFGFARATPVTHAATEAATAATLYGTTHLVTGAYTVTLPAVAVGMHGRFYATTAAVFSVDCNGADHFVLGGTALTAGNKVTSDGSAGAFFEWECTAANTITIFFSNVTFIDGGA